MTNYQYPITGMQHKRFDDGVDIFVHYTRLDKNIRMINSVCFTYNYCILEQKYDNTYGFFLNIPRTVIIGEKLIDVVARVRETIEDVESELESVSTDDRMAERLLTDTNGEIVPTHTAVQTDDHPTSISINSLSAINYDGTINLEAIGTKAQPIRPPAPKRKRTRWELLELD